MAAPAISDNRNWGGHQGTSTPTAWNGYFTGGPAAGERIFFFVRIAAGAVTNPTVSTPSGYTVTTLPSSLPNPAQIANNIANYVFHKVSTGSETAPTFNHPQGRFTWSYIVVSNFGSFDVGSAVETAGGSATVPSITTTGADRRLVHVTFASNGVQAAGAWTPTGWTNGPPDEVFDVGWDYNGLSIFQGTKATAGATGTKVASYSSGAVNSRGLFLAMAPQTTSNQAPTAAVIATPTVARPGEPVQLNASGSTDDTPIAWTTLGQSPANPTWQQISPTTPPLTINAVPPYGPVVVSVTSPTDPGTQYPITPTFRVTVTDAGGLSDTADVSWRISPGPSVSAGDDQTVTVTGSTTINFTATATAATGSTISSYQWTKVSGPSATITNATTATPSVTTTNDAAVWVFRVTVTDSDALTASDDVVITTQAGAPTVPVEFVPVNYTWTTGDDTATVELVVEVLGVASGDTQYVDEIGLFPGATASWTRGGLDGLSVVDVLRSDNPPENDDYEATGVIADAPDEVVLRYGSGLIPGAGNAEATTSDHEVPFSKAVRYRPISYTTTTDGVTFVALGAPVQVVVTAQAWWLSDPIEPENDMIVNVTGDSFSRSHRAEEIEVAGQGASVVSTIGPEPRSQRRFSVGLVSFDRDEMARLDTILSTGRTLLLRDMTGDKRWVRLVDDENWKRRFRTDLHDVELSLVEVARP